MAEEDDVTAVLAAKMVGAGLGAHTPTGFGTPGGCTRREARVSFWAVYRSAGVRAVGGFSSSQLYGLVTQSSVFRPMKLRFGPKSASGRRAFSLPLCKVFEGESDTTTNSSRCQRVISCVHSRHLTCIGCSGCPADIVGGGGKCNLT